MKHVEDFMRAYFQAQISEEKKYQANRGQFRRTFFSEDCRYGSHADTLMRMESEKIVSIDEGESYSKVITDQAFRYSGGLRNIRLRYHLQSSNDSWLICEVQRACLVCEGRGDSSCQYCKGKQFLDSGQSQI